MSKNPPKISLIGSRATSVLSVTLVLIVIGLLGTLGVAVHKATAAAGDNTAVLVTILPGEDPLRVSEIKRDFNSTEWISDYDFTSATEVLSREVDRMDSITLQGLELLSDNPFGDEFTVSIADGWRNTDSLSAVISRLKAMPGVDIVSADANVLGQANAGLTKLMVYCGILAVILLLISIALINNTISLSIYSRRFNIHTMKLVGATNAFIRRPFVRAGTVTGLIAGLIAALVVCLLQAYLMFDDAFVGPWLTPEIISITAVALVVLGTLFARAAAWRAANSYLKKSYDTLFRK